MAPPNSSKELQAAWRALAGEQHDEGWRTIQIGGNERPVRAGRHYPGDAEALVFGFRNVRVPATDEFPRGRGFHVALVDLGASNDGRTWIALSREEGASTELFTILAEDVIAAIADVGPGSDPYAFRLFLDRINAWQSFMQRQTHHILSAEAEVGLAGELLVLVLLISAGVPASAALDAWRGPLDGLQDFIFPGGAVEVKATVGSGSFPAKISSLEQLDDSLVQPLFLAAVRLSLRREGRSLPAIAADARIALGSDQSTLSVFDSRLIHAGLVPSHIDSYTRRFAHAETRYLSVSESFPRLMRSNVALQIRRALYEIDLDLLTVPVVDLQDVIAALGVH